ncbi:cation transporter [Klebsiella pneumoniae]|uniref:Cation transporter n=1 Tax=Klebsiella pneumoniae TaxID=573 RepID=A0A483NAN4_KLEPN|nr:cation transporter [Klebsiella pneumoniae]AZB78772.1 cation transporter [Klebsiella pneumoniae subsp. pneumoniae]CDK76229.1 Cation efflux system protein CusC precursor [Klebsiella pneumoniae IS22]EIW8619184.1 cation transporter [Klebsiella pneumoniae]EIW9236109.1 cation transporter [Klebsiella pneumoniae]
MKYQENDNFVIFPSRPEQSPLRKVAAMDKSSKLLPPCAQYSYLPSA